MINNEFDEIENGGAGSGDFDHAGRPGEVGGSEPAGTGRKGKYDKGNSNISFYRKSFKMSKNIDSKTHRKIADDLGKEMAKYSYKANANINKDHANYEKYAKLFKETQAKYEFHKEQAEKLEKLEKKQNKKAQNSYILQSQRLEQGNKY